ncbi:MAG: LamG-like jellyroll fold domain-containing protein [Chloroflexota bacterium]|nr:LamG-like jellyroll fold domain-containing protein [Chloroflexota bacterium]
MNEGSGVTTQDTIGSNHGTLMGGTSWTTSGKSGNALVFDGVDDYVIMNPFNGFPDDEITVELWMKSSDTTKNGTPFSYASVAHHNDFLIYNYRSTSIYRGDSNVNSGLSLNDGSWHHIAVTWKSSGGSVKLYEDGQPVYSNVLWSGTTITAGGSLVIAQEQDSIGGGFQVNQAFLGCIDEIVIYDQALSDSEILSRYNSY